MAFDQTIQEALKRLTTALQQDFDARLKAVADELAKSAEQERLAAEAETMSNLAAQIGTVRAEADRRVVDEVARARADAEEAHAEELARMRTDAEAARRENEDLRQETGRMRHELDQLTGELGQARERLAAAEHSRGELQRAAAAARDQSEQSVVAARAQAEESLGAVRAQAEQAATELADFRGRLATVEREREELRQQTEIKAQALEVLRQEDVAARVQERQEQLARLDRLVSQFRRLDLAASLSDVLTLLSEGVAAEAPRTAVLLAARDVFEPFRVAGFGGVAPRPVTRSEAATLTRGLPFAELPADHVGFAVPIEVGGRPVAMVYADDCTGREETVPASWPEAVEVLARHAAQRLETLTARRTVQALGAGRPADRSPVSTAGRTMAAAGESSTTEHDQSARRYARLLVSEIKLYNEATVRLGRMNRDLLERLRPEIARARKLYEERVPANVPARSTYFDDELVHTLADGDPALLGPRKS